jgi:hypothetical protein
MENPDFKSFFKRIPRDTLWVLDIDSTLVLTHKRNEVILHRFAQEFRSQYPEFCGKLAATRCLPLEYGYGKALERAGIAADKEAVDKLAIYWRKHFFSNDFLHHDIVHGDAVKFVQSLRKNNWTFVYLTGRPHPLMYDGTLRILSQFGFDVAPELLFLKPRPEDRDELYKSSQVAEWKKKYKNILFFDNEPKVLNQIDKDHPEIPMIFMDTCHSPNVVPPKKALHMREFGDLLPFI